MEKWDVFAFGILLLMLISKKACSAEECVKCDISLHKWVNKEFKREALDGQFGRSGYSLVHKSLEEDPVFCSEDGPKVTKLATDCLAICPSKRPSMKEAVDRLLNLRVVLHNALKCNCASNSLNCLGAEIYEN